MHSGLDQAGGEQKVPAAVTFPLAGRTLGRSHLYRRCDSGHLVELTPDPGWAATLAWYPARDYSSFVLWAAPEPLGGGSWAHGWMSTQSCKGLLYNCCAPHLPWPCQRIGAGVGNGGRDPLNSHDPETLSPTT